MSIMKACYSNLCEFKEALYQCDLFDSFYLKLVSILFFVFRDGKKYCFCDMVVSCPLCSIRSYFSNFKEDLRENRMNANYVREYRDNLFPFLIMCYVKKESSIACFAGDFFKMYDSGGNIQSDVYLLDFDVMLQVFFLFSAIKK